MAKVAALGCIVCDHCYGVKDTPAQVHHARVRHGFGRSSHLMVLPLCELHHTGKDGVHNHGRAEFEQLHGYGELDLLAIVQNRLEAA